MSSLRRLSFPQLYIRQDTIHVLEKGEYLGSFKVVLGEDMMFWLESEEEKGSENIKVSYVLDTEVFEILTDEEYINTL